MISLILVGKNEGWRLRKSLESVFRLIDFYPQFKFEVIYVDSKSTDDSIERAKAFKHIRIFEITGVTNSAIARNIGATEAKGDVLFFIDADMEIVPEFLENALNEKGELEYGYLTGHLDDYFYTVEDEFIGREPRTYKTNLPNKIQELNHNGGLCLIKKSVWISINGMRNKYKRSQDLDLTIRLKKRGVKIIRIPVLAAKHHTIDYRNEKRMWKMLLSGNGFYSPMLLRDHFLNKDVLNRILRSEYTAIVFLVFLFVIFFGSSSTAIGIGVFYFFLIAIRVGFQTFKANSNKSKFPYFVERYFFQILVDITFWSGFLLFHPKDPSLLYKKG